jgi:hypothetical protein
MMIRIAMLVVLLAAIALSMTASDFTGMNLHSAETDADTGGGGGKVPVAYLHIGPHKTGSTFFQNCMIKARPLLDMGSVRYHTNCDGTPLGFKGGVCMRTCNRNHNCHDCYECFAKKMQKQKPGWDIVISSEEMDTLDDQTIRKIHDELTKHGYIVKIIIAYRELLNVLHSLYEYTINTPVYKNGEIVMMMMMMMMMMILESIL